MTTSKWATIARCSSDTALRDITELVDRRILVRNAGGGRSTATRSAKLAKSSPSFRIEWHNRRPSAHARSRRPLSKSPPLQIPAVARPDLNHTAVWTAVPYPDMKPMHWRRACRLGYN